eukprot:gene27448-16997_t
MLAILLVTLSAAAELPAPNNTQSSLPSCKAGYFPVNLPFSPAGSNATCFRCSAGTFSTAGSDACRPKLPCPPETFYVDSPLEARTCTPCRTGTVQPLEAHREEACIRRTSCSAGSELTYYDPVSISSTHSCA